MNIPALSAGSQHDHLPAEGAPLRVHLAHACPIVRAGLAAILSGRPELKVTAQERWPHSFSEAAILIADYVDGLRAARHPWPLHPGHVPQVLVLTNHAKEWEVRQAVDLGVSGYLLRGCSA